MHNNSFATKKKHAAKALLGKMAVLLLLWWIYLPIAIFVFVASAAIMADSGKLDAVMAILFVLLNWVPFFVISIHTLRMLRGPTKKQEGDQDS